jgi:hypothetical protein
MAAKAEASPISADISHIGNIWNTTSYYYILQGYKYSMVVFSRVEYDIIKNQNQPVY